MAPAFLAIATHEGLVAWHDFLAEWHEGNRDHLQVGNGQGDADDGDRHGKGRGDVADHDPDAGNQKPNDISQRAGDARAAGLIHHGTAKGPKCVSGDAERGDSPRDRDDKNAAENSSREIAQGQPETAKHEPNDVQNSLHHSILPCQDGERLRDAPENTLN